MKASDVTEEQRNAFHEAMLALGDPAMPLAEYQDHQIAAAVNAVMSSGQPVLVDYVLMPKRLTAENGAKILLSGEFHELVEVHNACDCGDADCEECRDFEEIFPNGVEKVPVSWDTIKAIYSKAVEGLALQVQGDGSAVELKGMARVFLASSSTFKKGWTPEQEEKYDREAGS